MNNTGNATFFKKNVPDYLTILPFLPIIALQYRQ